VKEKRKGPIGRAAGLAEGVAATMRRLQRERGPRLLVYDETGYARLVQPNGRGYERLLETAEQMVAVVSQAEAEAKPRLVRRTEGAEDAKKPGRAEAKSRRAESESDRAEARSRRSEAKPGRAEPKPGRTESKPGRAGAKSRRADSTKPRRSPKRAPGDNP
jgi:hypothetical protein